MSGKFGQTALLLTLALMPGTLRTAAARSACVPVRLRCEYRDNPLGIDVQKPRFSWQLEDSRRGAKQTAYQLLVASDAKKLQDGQTDVWNSGKVMSAQSALVAYAGPALVSRRAYWWRVKVWDKDGKPADESAPARFETALMQTSDWKAAWIGLPVTASDNAEAEADLRAGKWVWFPEGNPREAAPTATRYFRTSFVVPADKSIKSAALIAAADNSFTAYVNEKQVCRGTDFHAPTIARVQQELKPGRNLLAISAHNDGGPAGLVAVLKITYADGSVQRVTSGGDWKTAQTAPAAGTLKWTAADYKEDGWQSALILANVGEMPWGTPSVAAFGGPAALLRKAFSVTKSVKEARVYVTALGSYRLHINGQRVGNDILTPDWTDYRKRITYQTYDVTKLVKSGENAVAALVGDGWYASGLGWGLQRNLFGPNPVRLRMQMHLAYTDGTEEMVVTDGSWRGAPSPVLRSEIYAGETYDARLEQPGWDRAGFRETGWKSVDALPLEAHSRLIVSAQSAPTIQVTETLKPKTMTNPAPGVYVYDMGQNMVGWVQMKASGAAGTTVRLRFAEIVNQDGTIYTQNLRRAEATDTYILRGDRSGQPETFTPHFTYHGFRYVEVTGYPGTPGMDAISGQVFHTAVPVTGTFTCSNPLVNQIVRNTDWGLRGNLESVPTDCPQRDERLGWMGDAQIIWTTACCLRDMASFTAKWMRDVVDAQSPEGGFSDVSPRVVDMSDGAPAWGDAGIIVPYMAWRQYADKQLLSENWEAMEKWMEYIHKANPDLLWKNRRNNDFGDWVPANSTTPKDLLATAYWANDARYMAQMAHALGKDEDAKRYETLHAGIKAAFVKQFIKADGTVGNGSQTCYALALDYDLVPTELRAAAAQRLADDVRARGMHLSTGFLGTGSLLPALSSNGYNDIAYTLLQTETYPGWGYMIKKGATTIWERWNGDTGDPGMNSYNHYAYGVVCEWLYRFAAGIETDPNAPGYSHFVLRPRLPSGETALTYVKASQETPSGTIRSAWERKAGQPLTYAVTIPANTSATVYIPATDPQHVREGGKAIAPGAGIRFVRYAEGCAIYEVEAGTYHFTTD